MKKKILKSCFLNFIYVPFFLLILSGCFLDGDNSSDSSNLISGIFHSEPITLDDGSQVMISFSFDEIDDDTINGGVKIAPIPPDNFNFSSDYYLKENGVTSFEKSSATAAVEGSVEIGDELGTFTYSGTLTQDEFTFTYSCDLGSGSATATYDGQYYKSSSTEKSFSKLSFIGTHEITFYASDNFGYESCTESPDAGSCAGYGPSCDNWNATLVVTDDDDDGFGGIFLTGTLSSSQFPNTSEEVTVQLSNSTNPFNCWSSYCTVNFTQDVTDDGVYINIYFMIEQWFFGDNMIYQSYSYSTGCLSNSCDKRGQYSSEYQTLD
ncbi:MAG: hypothetical protein ABIA04_07095 [Pseudomonadota bacterium]